MGVTDLYTMILQEGGITAIKKLIEASDLKQSDGLKKETLTRTMRHSSRNSLNIGLEKLASQAFELIKTNNIEQVT
jgi:hypothetical protein